MLTAVLSGFLLAAIAPWVHRAAGRHSSWAFALLPLALSGYFASHIPAIMDGEVVSQAYVWAPGLGIQLSFYLDGLGLLFALLISGIGVFIVLYSGAYLKEHAYLGRFFIYILSFMAAMLGLVLADNLITLFVFWELTSIISYLLIGFDHQREEARKAALQGLLVTVGGGLALLAGFILLAQVGGSWEVSQLVGQGDLIRGHTLYFPILLLVLIGAFTKSAQFPFHFWLPGAMQAPTPVSAYLHSATMVKAGIYLLARLSPALSDTEVWFVLVSTFGAVTMLTGTFLVLRNTDLKLVLAYTTVTALGTLTMLLGLDTELAVRAAVVFLLVHSLYKGALFLAVGSIDHETGTREAIRLAGLWRSMPVTMIATVLAALSMAGVPPLFGFIGKELVYQKVLAVHPEMPFFIVTAVTSGVVLVAAAGIVGLRPFIGSPSATPKHPHEAPLAMWLGPVILAGAGLLLGLFPTFAEQLLLGPAEAAILGRALDMKLSLWHGFNVILLLSALTLAGGIAIYRYRERVRGWLLAAEPVIRWGPEHGYERALGTLNWTARVQTRILQNGYLRYYLLTLIVTTIVLVGYTLLGRSERFGLAWTHTGIFFYEAVVAAILLLAALAAVRIRARLGAVAALGVGGYGVALIYVLYGAPDLAITQVLVETLTVILFVLVFYHLPRFAALSSQFARCRDAVISLLAGGLMTMLVLAATDAEFFERVSGFFVEHSAPSAFGRNIVNVILVDFRALDTLGEIVVLVLAAVGVTALMRLYPGSRGDSR